MNLVSGRCAVEEHGGVAVMVGPQRLAFDDAAMARHPGASRWNGRVVTVGIRPEALSDATVAPDHTLEAEVELIEALGPSCTCTCA